MTEERSERQKVREGESDKVFFQKKASFSSSKSKVTLQKYNGAPLPYLYIIYIPE
jgi:hypothetical protein